jgi:hypothetical protein
MSACSSCDRSFHMHSGCEHRNLGPSNVVKATLGGSASQGFGNGNRVPIRRIDRGVGMRTVRGINLARGILLRKVDLSNLY